MSAIEELLAFLKAQPPKWRDESQRQALAAGACAYVTKNSAGDILIEAVREVHAGRGYLSPDIRNLASAARPAAPGPDSLSPREFEVFRLLAQGHTVAQIADSLKLSQKTVANHQTRIKEKLGVQTTAALVHRALQSGAVDREFFPRQDEER